jgi:tight adherence protein B
MISLPIIIVLIFLGTLGLVVSGLYFFVATPLAKRNLKMRLTSVPAGAAAGPDDDILRRAVLNGIPALLNKVFSGVAVVEKLEFFLQQAAVRMQAATFLTIVIGATVLTALVTLTLELAPLACLLATVAVAGAPFLVISYMRSRRFAKFEEQLPDAIDLLARAVRAGHAFTTAFSLIADEMGDPIAEEFRITYRQQNLGLPLREAFENLVRRVPLADVRIFVTALQIQRESGGNLGEILDNLASVIRERFKIMREVKVLTAEARLSMYALTGLPFAAGLFMWFANPDYMRPLITDPIGRQSLVVAGVMQVIGYTIIKKLIKIKI